MTKAQKREIERLKKKGKLGREEPVEQSNPPTPDAGGET